MSASRRKPEPEPELEQEEEEAEVSEDEDVDGDESDPDDEEEPEEEEEEQSAEDDEAEEPPDSSKPSPSSSTPRRVGRPRKEDSAPRQQVSKKEAAELFKKYEERKGIVGELTEHMNQAKAEVAQAAFEIYEKLGVGPFRWKGKTLKVFKSKKNPNSARIRVISDEALEIG
jgi:hypothetical protein